jgi:hypothetical protein
LSLRRGFAKYRDLEPLENLEALVLESMRMHSATPAALRGLFLRRGQILRIDIPGGVSVWFSSISCPNTDTCQTAISTQRTTLHYNPSTFPSPRSFSPRCWIDTNGGTPDMKEAYQPWSKGSRMCMGIHLATMEVKLILTALINQYEISLGEGTTDDSMTMISHFVLMTKAGKCDLAFTRLEK